MEESKEASFKGFVASKQKGETILDPTVHGRSFHCIIQGKELLESSNSRVQLVCLGNIGVWRIGEALVKLVDSPIIEAFCRSILGFIKRIERRSWVTFGTGELITFDPELERLLRNAHRALRFETVNNNTIIAIEKTEEDQEAPPYINPLFVPHSPPPMAEKTMADYARPSIFGMQSSIARLRLRNEILSFQQIDGESQEAWKRWKELLRKCPHHRLGFGIQIQSFYNGLKLAGVNNVITATEARLAAIVEQKMGNLTTIPINKNSQPVMFCEFCSRGHPNHEFPSIGGPMEQVDYV
ncbi:hypothetical protein M9H77_23445 [Catharanthus roseus]|uniref:Uncharacterized protein n=1 Tax=Catharanthus roseus TaxID=4058 RepID=A0ACC0ASY6_CATRO|nr:hypothetical protein M9H77_23445 [Catharanthus roseus]